MTLTAQAPPAAEADPVHRRRRWLAPIAAATALLLIVAATGLASIGGPQPADPGPLNEPTVGSAAAGPLIAMADLLTATPADATTGVYSHMVIEHWSRADDQIIGFLDTFWRNDNDGATNIQQRRTPPYPARNFDLAKIGVPGSFNPYAATATTYGAAEGNSFIEMFGEPPSPNPDRLTRQIDSINGGQPLTAPCPPTCGRTIEPHVFLDAVISLHRDTYLNRETRAAVLRSVAVLPGLDYLGPVEDRAGRQGIGVAMTYQGVRFTLLFDRDTGVLLASERAVPGFVLDDYSLYHQFERRDSLPPTA